MTGLFNQLNLNRWLVVALLFPLIFLNGWLLLKVLQYFQPIFTILILATLLAFILHHPVWFLQQRGLSRNLAVSVVFLGTALILIALGVTLIPALLEQIGEIANVLPYWIESGQKQLDALHEWIVSHNLPISFSQLISQIIGRLPGQLQALSDQVVDLILGTIGDVSEGILTAVLTFYLLLDGERLWNGIFEKLPVSFGPQVKCSLRQTFQNYFIGQIAMATLVGCTMTTAFLVLQVPYGLLFGLSIGVFALVPFGDVFSLALVSLLVASQDFRLGVKTLITGVVLDQIIDQAIAPRLLGRFTGLRPMWVIVSLLVGTKIGGLLGLLIAVPIASFIKSAIDGFPEYRAAIEAEVGNSESPTLTHSESDLDRNQETLTSNGLVSNVPDSNGVTSQGTNVIS